MVQKRINVRDDFPMLSKKMHGKPLIYLDSAATAQKPQCVIDALADFYTNHYATVHRAIYDLSMTSTENYSRTREKVRAFLNAASADEIVFTRGTTDSINLACHCFGKACIKPGDEVLITEIEHHSNIVPWQIMCQDRGAKLRVTKVTDQGELDLHDFEKKLSQKTKIVAIAHVSNALGTIHPIKKIVEMAHQKGARVLVDGAQGAQHMPTDVQSWNVDFYAFSGHKAYGPTGIGILYGKKELLEQMPPMYGGGDMIESVEFGGTTYTKPPMKFEAGTPMIAQVIGLGRAIDYLQALGLENIYSHEQELTKHATKQMQEIEGLRIIGTAPEKGAVISFVCDGIHHLDLGTMLDVQGVAVRTGHHCTQPAMKRFGVPGTARASFGLYNTLDEVDRFVEILKDVLKKFR